MPELVIFSDNGVNTIKFSGNPTVSELLFVNGMQISATCGGTSNCGKCLMLADTGFCEPDETEKQLIKPGCRLACRARLCGDATVIVGKLDKVKHNAGFVRAMANPNKGNEIPQKGYGVIADIGTALIKITIFELKNKKMIVQKSCENPQKIFGLDEESRIAMSATVSGKKAVFREILTNALADLINKACAQAGIRQSKISRGVLTGTTSMLYFINGYDVSALYYETDPYVRTLTKHLEINGIEFICLNPINRFIGADMTAIFAGANLPDKGVYLICDIGAKAKLVLKKNGELYAAVTENLLSADANFQNTDADIKTDDALKISSAILSAVNRLAKKAKITCADIDNIYVSGGFAKFPSVIPKELADKCTYVTDAVVNGAIPMLYDVNLRRVTKKAVRTAIFAD